MPATSSRKVADLRALIDVMRGAEGFADVREALLRGEGAAIDGAWGSACALAAAALAGTAGQRAASKKKVRKLVRSAAAGAETVDALRTSALVRSDSAAGAAAGSAASAAPVL